MDERALKSRNQIIRALAEGPKTFGELLEKTGLSNPTLAEHIKALESEGRIKSEMDPNDRRRRIYHLNNIPKGRVGEFILVLNSKLGSPLSVEEQNKLVEIIGSKEEDIFKCVEEIISEWQKFAGPLAERFGKLDLLTAVALYSGEKELANILSNPQEMREMIPEIVKGRLGQEARHRFPEFYEGVLRKINIEPKLIATRKIEKNNLVAEFDALADFFNSVIAHDSVFLSIIKSIQLRWTSMALISLQKDIINLLVKHFLTPKTKS